MNGAATCTPASTCGDPEKMVPALANIYRAPKIKSVLLAQFDNEIGRIIRAQFPPDLFDKKAFATFNSLVLPTHILCNRMIKHETQHNKIMGNAVVLCDHEKYKRNYFYFNLCFVLELSEKNEQILEPVLQKIADYLVELEKECDFLSKPLPDDSGAKNLVEKIFTGLYLHGECNFLATSRSVVALKITMPYQYEMKSLPSMLAVPAFTRTPLPTEMPELFKKMDMVSQKIVPFVNGVFTIREIAHRVKIDAEIVGRCVRQLIYCGTIILLPQFLFGNCYYTTDLFLTFLQAKTTQKECCEFVKRQSCIPGPEVKDIMRLYGGLRPGWKAAHWQSRFNPRRMNVDERKLIQFGIYYGFVRKQDMYPVALEKENTKIAKLCNGEHTLDDIALRYGTTTVRLQRIFEASPKFALIYR